MHRNNDILRVLLADHVRNLEPRRFGGGGGVATAQGLFRVLVVKDGGDDGDKDTAATYTYTVKSLDGHVLDTTIAVTRPRPKGEMIFQTGDSAVGWAYRDQTGALKLWDAGEVEGTIACTEGT